MWGSTTPNTNTPCDWEHAPFNNHSSNYNETYFNSVKKTVCPNGVLAKEYDAATQIMGGDWRMPTQTDFQELLNGTTNEWIADYNDTGVSGRKFTSKTNGKSIFFPANGHASGTGVYQRGTYGKYWSSSLSPSRSNYGLHLNFNSGSIDPQYDDRRYFGFCVRGVRK